MHTAQPGLRILHTSDWHLGAALYNRPRHEEMECFVEWLLQVIREEAIDTVLIAGDVFDCSYPSPRAQKCYYHFLAQAASTGCRHVVVTAGNHDAPKFLDAPRELLAEFNVQVVGKPDSERELIVLRDSAGAPELIVAAVPFLRETDVRRAEAGEECGGREQKITAGICARYAAIAARAAAVRTELGGDIPIIAMGHLYAAGSQIAPDAPQVGTLGATPATIFSPEFAYFALGHLHIPQSVGGNARMRYCGSPIPMTFGEAGQNKEVCIFNTASGEVRSLPVPVWQKLESVRGGLAAVISRLQELAAADTAVWAEILYEGTEVVPDLAAQVRAAVEGSQVAVLRIDNRQIVNRVLDRSETVETLQNLDVYQVFARLLAADGIPPEQQEELTAAYREAAAAVNNQAEEE